MNHHEAKFLLRAYRPGSSDAQSGHSSGHGATSR